MADIALRLIIEGRVQRVGFRYWTESQAAARGLDGWVRNLPDGRVEALFAGPETTVRDMVQACWQGPTMARVAAVHEYAAESPAEPGFRHYR